MKLSIYGIKTITVNSIIPEKAATTKATEVATAVMPSPAEAVKTCILLSDPA